MLYYHKTALSTMDVSELQNEQLKLAYDLKSSKNKYEKRDLYVQYDCTRRELLERLGQNAHVADIDFDLYETFVDMYKTDYGEKPKNHFTMKDVHSYMVS